MATLQNFDAEIAKTKQVVEQMRSKIEQSAWCSISSPRRTRRSATPISTSRTPASRTC